MAESVLYLSGPRASGKTTELCKMVFAKIWSPVKPTSNIYMCAQTRQRLEYLSTIFIKIVYGQKVSTALQISTSGLNQYMTLKGIGIWFIHNFDHLEGINPNGYFYCDEVELPGYYKTQAKQVIQTVCTLPPSKWSLPTQIGDKKTRFDLIL